MAAQQTSRRPYLVRAMHEWMTANNQTPHLVVDAATAGAEIPKAYVREGRITLNVSWQATQGLKLGNDWIEFNARFGGVPQQVRVPIAAVLGIYARETGQGMLFQDDGDAPPGRLRLATEAARRQVGRRMSRWSQCVLALGLAVVAGCEPRIEMPPPDTLIVRSDAIRDRVESNERLLARGEPAAQLPRLDAVLNAIAAEYGEQSIELAQATTDTGVMLIAKGDRYDLSEAYFERALELSREVFGPEHRETGFALHDLAVVRNELRQEPFDERVRPLIKEAIAVRSRVVGPEHEETAASEGALAGWLLGLWTRAGNGDPKSHWLVEADRNVAHALTVMERVLGHADFEVMQMRYLKVEIALARREFRQARVLAQDLVRKYQRPCGMRGGSRNARQLEAAALRGLGRAAEAARLEAAAPPDECPDG
jgi:stringent starvation protein B